MKKKQKNIINAAEKVFARYGYKKTSMEDIAEEAHIGKATIYYYYPGKEDVFYEVIRKDTEKFKNTLDKEVSNVEMPDDRLRTYVKERMAHLDDLMKFYPTLTKEYLDNFTLIEKIRDELNEYEKRVLCMILQEGVDKSVFMIPNIESTAKVLIIAIKGLEYAMIKNKFGYDIEQESERLINIIINGLIKK